MSTIPDVLDVGGTYEFYGIDNHRFKLGDRVFEALEDESDGYRSYLGSIEVVSDPGSLDIFFGRPVDTVKFEDADEGDFEGFELRSESDGHIWLRVGTDNSCDYYPCFVFEYLPREP